MLSKCVKMQWREPLWFLMTTVADSSLWQSTFPLPPGQQVYSTGIPQALSNYMWTHD